MGPLACHSRTFSHRRSRCRHQCPPNGRIQHRQKHGLDQLGRACTRPNTRRLPPRSHRARPRCEARTTTIRQVLRNHANRRTPQISRSRASCTAARERTWLRSRTCLCPRRQGELLRSLARLDQEGGCKSIFCPRDATAVTPPSIHDIAAHAATTETPPRYTRTNTPTSTLSTRFT